MEVGRRRLLTVGLGLATAFGAGGLTGCTVSDPRISSDGQRPSPSPAGRSSTGPTTPRPTTVAPRRPVTSPASEQALADLAAAILTGRRRGDLTGGQRELIAAVRDAHLQHVAALRSPRPLTRPVSPLPSAAPTAARKRVASLSLGRSVDLLAKSEREQAARTKSAATRATGFEALLSGSMSVAAGSYAAALTAGDRVSTSVKPDEHRPMAAVSDVEALQSMVRQLHAIVFGYQLALGRLSPSSAGGRRASSSLRSRKALRDQLERELVARSANVPAAAAAYVPSVKPTSAARAGLLIRRMESALRPFCGLWLASATTATDRRVALAALTRTDATARAWGAPLIVWPGWSD